MAMLSKSKGDTPPEPRVCARCKSRPGTVRLHFTAPPDSPDRGTGEREAWLCQPCVEEIRRGRPDAS
jgi:hypothetical protein